MSETKIVEIRPNYPLYYWIRERNGYYFGRVWDRFRHQETDDYRTQDEAMNKVKEIIARGKW